MGSINPKIFRSYDIRGIYPDDLNEETVRKIGAALSFLVKEKFKNIEKPRVIIGRDMRQSSEPLFKALTDKLTEQGFDVYDIGLVTVDALYFAVGKFGYEAGVMITASHNPKEYGGMKMVFKNMEWLRGVDIRDLVIEQDNIGQSGRAKGEVHQHDIWPEFIKHVRSFVDDGQIENLKVVVDAGNGMAGKAVPLITKGLDIEIIPMYFELDGSFPNRPSNPLEPGAADAVKEKVLREKADFGVMFDGDTDRLMFVDEQGKFVQADTTLILLAKYFLEKFPGKGVAYNTVCTKAVPEFVEKFGGHAIRTKVGFVNVSKGEQEHDGILGGEVSAHYSFRDNFYADSGMIAFLVILQLAAQSDKKFSELVKDYTPYCRGNEVNLEIEDTDRVIGEIKQKYADAKNIDELDGVTVEYEDWWFNVRPSNTEPLLRITVEANTCREMEEKRKSLVDFIKEISST